MRHLPVRPDEVDGRLFGDPNLTLFNANA